MPYSVSMPHTLGMATDGPYPGAPADGAFSGAPSPTAGRLEVLASPHAFDGASTGRLLALGQQGANVDDPLALLARDLGPVVGVGGVGQVLVLLVLLLDGSEEIVEAYALAGTGDRALDGELLGPPHDVLDHGARREVLEEQDLLVAVLGGDLEEAVVVVGLVHLDDGALDHGRHGLAGVAAAEGGHLVRVEREVGREVTPEDLGGGGLIGPLDLDLHVEPARPEDGGVDEVLAVG